MSKCRWRTLRDAAPALVTAGATLLVAGCGSGDASSPTPTQTPAAASWFEPADAGIAFRHVRGPSRYLFPEIMGGGAGWLDADGDGDLDLYLVQGGDLLAEAADRPPNRLFRNIGSGRFEEVPEAGGADDRGYGMGCVAGDYDGDGDVDLYVTNVGANTLYRNEGDGTFTDVTAATGVGDTGWGTSAAFSDLDADGDLDLFVVNYIGWSPQRERECRSGSGARDYCEPNNYNAPARDVFYRNDGDGTFTDASEAAGLHRAFGNGLGLACGDFDGDGRTDVYVANDGMPNQLWINQGDGRFVDRALLSGCALNMQGRTEAGMGVAAVDVEDDGDLDLFMTHIRDESNTFYLNRGGTFEDATVTIGLSGPSIRYTGFGVGFADFDLDGLLDVYIANGRVGTWDPAPDPADPYAEPNQLYLGMGIGQFRQIEPIGGCATCGMGNSRAAAFADYDDDGDVDVVVANNDGEAVLLRNVAERRGHWVTFRVLDDRGADAIGAALTIEGAGRTWHRRVQPAYSYCATNDPRVHVGLGGVSTVDAVTVRLPTGRVRRYAGPFETDRFHVLRP